MNSKTLGIFIILIFVVLAAATFFQVSEMVAYDLPTTLKARFFGGGEVAQVATPAPTTTDGAE